MTDPRVVRFAIEYLDECMAKGAPATLAGMHLYIDASNKTPPLLSEVNEALKQRPSIRIQRNNGSVVFGSNGTESSVTDEDMGRADKQYRKEFWASIKKAK